MSIVNSFDDKRIAKFKESPVFYIDFDNTLLNSVRVYCETFNVMHYANADWEKGYSWNLEEICPSQFDGMVNGIFSRHMWDYMDNEACDNPKVKQEFYYDGAIDFIDYATRVGTAYVVTVGTDENIINKSKFLNETLNKDLGKLYIVKEEAFELKAKIDMSDGIVIDDRTDVLQQSNALYKVRFGKDFSWNVDWKPDNITSFSCETWEDVNNLMKKLMK